MSDFRWEKKAVAHATKVYLIQSTFHGVGFGIHMGNKYAILSATQMDTQGHRLLYEMDRSDPHEASYRRSNHPISGDKHIIKI
jgi:hypothetical protein